MKMGLPDQSIQLLKYHLQRFNEEWKGKKNYAILKRFFKIYLHSFRNATALRARMMESQHCEEGIEILELYEKSAQAYPV
jgi:tRNA-dihydrouridine synthase